MKNIKLPKVNFLNNWKHIVLLASLLLVAFFKCFSSTPSTEANTGISQLASHSHEASLHNAYHNNLAFSHFHTGFLVTEEIEDELESDYAVARSHFYDIERMSSSELHFNKKLYYNPNQGKYFILYCCSKIPPAGA